MEFCTHLPLAPMTFTIVTKEGNPPNGSCRKQILEFIVKYQSKHFETYMSVDISATQSSMEALFDCRVKGVINSKLLCTDQMMLFGGATYSLPPAGLKIPDLLCLRRGE